MSRADLALVLGAAVAVAMVGFGLVGPSDAGRARVPEGAVAVVDGRAITVQEYRRAVAAVGSDSRNPVDQVVRERVLQRLIDEELLVQRGAELDLTRDDRVLRNALSTAVIDQLVARGRARADSPSEAELQEFYLANRRRFSASERLRLRQRSADGSIVVAPVPDVLLPLHKLRDYLGASALAAVLALEPGESTTPLPAAQGGQIYTLLERSAAAVRPFGSVREQVLADYYRRAGEAGLRHFLDRQRERVPIAIARERM